MGWPSIFTESTLARYIHAIKHSPRELILNSRLLLTVALYASAGIPITWDQGSSSVVPSLPGFQLKFGITSAANPEQISNFVSLVYVGAGVGGGLSFFLNDRIGRLWSFRLYSAVYIVGQLIATLSDGHLGALYTARIISGLGIGSRPDRVPGLLSVWFSVAMLLALTVSCLVVLAAYLHVAVGAMQYQIVFFVPMIVMAVMIAVSFFLYESPRWLSLAARDDEALHTLTTLRGLPESHHRVTSEMDAIRDLVQHQKTIGTSLIASCREAFLVPSNLRRVQQAVLSYALAQLSGANSVTSYLVPILSMMGLGGGTERSLFLTSMYSMAKFFFTLMASFFFIDALGRRKSLFLGITIQMISDIYIGVFIKWQQARNVTGRASDAAVAAIFLHGFGYAVGLLILPYVFGAEVWPNQIRSFGASFSQLFHWLFYFGVNKGMPSLLTNTHNWGAFLFFAGWCFVALLYVFFIVPETAGLGLESLDAVFEQPLWKAYLSTRRLQKPVVVSAEDP
ncbi:general substrate transporter [Aspergillus steynii IBT 23096]|uniref:General substrate transporter n=1 Tax=Aspergillus steynii IBT 23096 TaxID=1392250 RepID=A0A2I2GH92_9EURO|nr:general substrate transporter [Aspergillus steynii IBT 23096]PLB52250.1 general substrate transporter [Aspergillus steynii IBT 23096]